MSAAPYEDPLHEFIRPASTDAPAVPDSRQAREIIGAFLLGLGAVLLIAVLGLYDYRLGLGGVAVALMTVGLTLGIDQREAGAP